MTAARYTVVEQPYGGHCVQDTQTGENVTARGDILETQDACETLNRVDALAIKPGDTVTGWNTSNRPRRFTVTVDRVPWPSGMRNLIVSDGRSVEAMRLDGIEVRHN
jgi:hypothetical protein